VTRIPRATAVAFALALVSPSCDRSGRKPGPPAEVEPAPPRAAPAGPESAGHECAVLVRGSSGLPLSSVRVEMLREDGRLVAGGLTDAQGVARFRVPAGNYDVRIAKDPGEILARVGYEISGDTPTPIEVVIGSR
jgi:hypothetical protein